MLQVPNLESSAHIPLDLSMLLPAWVFDRHIEPTIQEDRSLTHVKSENRVILVTGRLIGVSVSQSILPIHWIPSVYAVVEIFLHLLSINFTFTNSPSRPPQK